ncbi:MAG: hypothetical protein R3F49_08620 [Planctomycetota bacterium]
MKQHIRRRDFLRQAALVGGLAPSLLASGALALPRRALAPLVPGRKTKHVVLIAFSGGVRSRETFGTPDNVPSMLALAKEGVSFPRLKTSNLGHFGASMSIFTGISEPRGIRDNQRGPDPTVFEYLRKDLGLAQGEVWVTTSGGAQQTNYSYGLHPEYGARYGATILDGDGIFNAKFKTLLDEFGRPKPASEREAALVERLRRGISDGGRETGDEREALARVEKYILDELTRGTTGLSGANAGDAKALRLARNLLTIFKPRVVGVVLQNADVAHTSFNAYSEVVRRNDAAIGELMAAIRADDELRDSTAVFVLPEFGRDHDLNSRRGLDHGDGSDDLNYVHGVAWGPDFKRGRVVEDELRTIDVTPTICSLFGAEAKLAKGDVLRGLFA